MRQEWDRAPVVVGVDGSLAARRAVRFAAEEAALRGLPLRIVTAAPWPAIRGRSGLAARRADLRMLADADAALTEAAELAEEFVPRACVATVTAVGWAAAALVEESRLAELVVVGNRGLGGFSGLMLGSVGVEVSAGAECPVVVVPDVGPADVAAPGRPPVVVGVDGTARSQDALTTAFLEAELRGAPLFAVHAWTAPVVVGAAALAAALEPYRDKHPDVAVVQQIVQGQAAAVLVAASAGAGLLVVGCRGRGPLAGLTLGSVSQAAIQHAQCPVLVVRSARTGYDED